MLKKDLENLKTPDTRINSSKVFFTLQPSPTKGAFFSPSSVSPSISNTSSPVKGLPPKCARKLNFNGHIPSNAINIPKKPKNR